MQLHQQVVLITGANGGLGTSVTDSFLYAGAIVIGVSPSIANFDFPSKNFLGIAGEISGGDQVGRENRDRGITENVILPGTIDTPANRTAMAGADFSKWVQPGQVAKLLVHLATAEVSQSERRRDSYLRRRGLSDSGWALNPETTDRINDFICGYNGIGIVGNI